MNDSTAQLKILKAANSIAHLLIRTQHVDEVIQDLMNEFLEFSQADEGSIQLIRPSSEVTRLTLVRAGEKNQNKLDSRLDDMLTGRTVRYQQAFRTNDIVSELNLGTSAVKRYAAISSILSIPIKLNEQVIGVVNLLRLDMSSPFSTSDQEMLVSLASQIAEYIEQAHLREKLFSDYELLKNEIKDRYAIHGIIGRSASMSEVFAVLDRVIPTDGRVLLQGESGTGKERIAKVIHYEGPRKNGPFVAVDCGALPPNLLESELFGYVRGAFTGANRDRKGLFEAANNGTLFLDEIANTTVEIQAKLLRVLQEGEVRPLGTNRAREVKVRIITAASSDLQEKLDKNEFRLDLFYRLNIVPIHIPPLRDRIEDIPLLACHFLEKFKTAHKKQLQRIAPSTIQILEKYNWPGNVRELENVIERSVILADRNDKVLQPEHLPFEISFTDGDRKSLEVPISGDLPAIVARYEREVLIRTLHHHNWNKSAAARALNISERVMRYKIKQLKIKK